jgi:hypothetical protein
MGRSLHLPVPLKSNGCSNAKGTAFGESSAPPTRHEVDCIKEIIHRKMEIKGRCGRSFPEEFTAPSCKYGGVKMIREPKLMSFGISLDDISVCIGLGNKFIAIHFAIAIEVIGS